MYASLIGAGISQLYDMYKSATANSSTTSGTGATSGTSFRPPPGPPPSDASNGASGSADAVNSAGSGGSNLSDAVQKLLADFQASTSTGSTETSANATDTIAGDLQSVFKNFKAGHGHGGHHPSGATSGSPAGDDGQSAPTGASSPANPFQNLASSLLAYAKTQNLSTASTTSLTA